MTDRHFDRAMLVDERNPADFLQSLPFSNRIRALLAPRPYILGIDPNRFTASNIRDPGAAYKAGYQFAIIEAVWGTNKTTTFDALWPPLLAAGFALLAYGFFRGDQQGGDQADALLETTRPMFEAQGFRTPLGLDVEPWSNDPSTLANRILNRRAWEAAIMEQVRALEYSNIPSWKSQMANDPLPEAAIGWAAHWTSSTDPAFPVGWIKSQVKFHQIGVATKYSWCSAIPGISGPMDVDRFYGTYDDLMLLASDNPGTDPEPDPLDLQPIYDRLDLLEAWKISADGLHVSLAQDIGGLESRVDALEHPGPATIILPVTADKTLAHYISGYNNAKPVNLPIMTIKEDPRIRFDHDTLVEIYPGEIDTDGPTNYYKLAGDWETGIDLFVQAPDFA